MQPQQQCSRLGCFFCPPLITLRAWKHQCSLSKTSCHKWWINSKWQSWLRPLPTTSHEADQSPSASPDRIWQDLIINSVFPLSVSSEVRPTRLALSQLLMSTCMAAVSWLLCHQYAGDILLSVFFSSDPDGIISFLSLNLAKTKGWMRISWKATWQEGCKVWGDGQEDPLPWPDCAHLCQWVWQFLSISRICWLSDSHMMNFPATVFQHATSGNRLNPDFSQFHLLVGLLQGAALTAAWDKTGEVSSRREPGDCLATQRAWPIPHACFWDLLCPIYLITLAVVFGQLPIANWSTHWHKSGTWKETEQADI